MRKNLLFSLVAGALLVPAAVSAQSYQTPGGSMHSDGTTYVENLYTEGVDNNVSQSWNATPDNIYQLVEGTVELAPGASFTLHLEALDLGDTSEVRQDLRYDRAFIFTDWDRDGVFTQERVYGVKSPTDNKVANYETVMNIAHLFTVPEDAAWGESRIRVIYHNAWQDLSSANATDISDGMVYDITVNVQGTNVVPFTISFSEAENGTFEILQDGVAISSGDQINNGTALTIAAYPNDGYRLDVIYVNGVAHEGLTFTVIEDTEVVVTFTDAPVEYATPGGSMHSDGSAYVANLYTEGADINVDQSWDATPDNVYQLVEDKLKAIRGKSFTLHLEANDLGDTSEARQDLRYNRAFIFTDWDGDGEFTQEQVYGEKNPLDNIAANYSSVMNITHTFAVPANALLGESRIRVIYHNAWQDLSSANATDVADGMIYDIVVVAITESNGIAQVSGNQVALYYNNGTIYTNAEGEVLIYNLTGKLVKSAHAAVIDVNNLSNGVYIAKAGGKAIKFVK